jgi:DNA-binding MarR family transcriptional regulator/N-acetylglutamate synthase-like GNAT family acetyltransferase
MNKKSNSETAERIRKFNRFYTRQIGLIDRQYLESPYSLTEARVLYELANQYEPTATRIKNELGLDAGYMSRILQKFNRLGLVETQISRVDGRQNNIHLTEKGLAEFSRINGRSHQEIEVMLQKVNPDDQSRLINAMQTIEAILTGEKAESNPVPVIIRQPVPGDMGWVVKRHGELYSEEYGWNEQFEGLVAEIVAKFVQNFDASRERCWIAEMDGKNVGCIFLVKLDEDTAKLRMLLVDPRARGMGLGKKLVDECILQARRFGYKKMVLWTNSILDAAIHLYIEVGFHKVNEEPQHSYGKDLVFENWEMDLRISSAIQGIRPPLPIVQQSKF